MDYVFTDGNGKRQLRVPVAIERPAVLLDLLTEIGLTLPLTSARLAAAEGKALGAAGKRFTETEIDTVLDSFTGLDPADRLSIKLAMQSEGLIGRGAT